MRYHLALWLYGIARHLNPNAGVSVTVSHHDGLETLQADLHGNRLRGTWQLDGQDCEG